MTGAFLIFLNPPHPGHGSRSSQPHRRRASGAERSGVTAEIRYALGCPQGVFTHSTAGSNPRGHPS